MKTIEEAVYEIQETQRCLIDKSIENIIFLIDELKQSEDERHDEIEKLIKQGLYLIKFIIKTS